MNTSVFQPSTETADAVNYLVNHDLKALSYTELVRLGGAAAGELAREVTEHAHPDAFYAVASYPRTFVRANFATATSEIGVRSSQVRVFIPKREEPAIAAIGAGEEWSEDYDYPLVRMFAKSGTNGEGSAPLNTIQILDGLRQGLGIGEMGLPGYATHRGGKTDSHASRLATLVELGLVEPTNPVTVRILDPRYKGTMPFERLKSGRQAFYQTLMQAHELEPEKEWNVDELKTQAEQWGFINDSNLAGFSTALSQALSLNEPKYSPGVVEKRDLTKGIYSINPRFAPMIHDLIERLIRLDQSPTFRAKSRDFAMDAYTDTKTAHRIASRGLTFSPFRRV